MPHWRLAVTDRARRRGRRRAPGRCRRTGFVGAGHEDVEALYNAVRVDM